MREHPGFAGPSDTELNAKGRVERAEILVDLQQLKEAATVLAGGESQRAHYLAGRIARMRGDAKQMNASFANVTDPNLLDDVRVERARLAWDNAEFAAMLATLAGSHPMGDWPGRFFPDGYTLSENQRSVSPDDVPSCRLKIGAEMRVSEVTPAL